VSAVGIRTQPKRRKGEHRSVGSVLRAAGRLALWALVGLLLLRGLAGVLSEPQPATSVAADRGHFNDPATAAFAVGFARTYPFPGSESVKPPPKRRPEPEPVQEAPLGWKPKKDEQVTWEQTLAIPLTVIEVDRSTGVAVVEGKVFGGVNRYEAPISQLCPIRPKFTPVARYGASASGVGSERCWSRPSGSPMPRSARIVAVAGRAAGDDRATLPARARSCAGSLGNPKPSARTGGSISRSRCRGNTRSSCGSAPAQTGRTLAISAASPSSAATKRSGRRKPIGSTGLRDTGSNHPPARLRASRPPCRPWAYRARRLR
jgi:hypothetical protein